MTEKFIIEPVEDWAQWDDCVNASPQGSIFFSSVYLKSTRVPSQAWLIRKGSAIRGGLCVQEARNGEECRLDDLVIHNGIWFLSDNNKKLTRTRGERFEIAETAIDFLTNRYSVVELALPPQLEDLRPFLWHNYHDPPDKKFHISLRYTSYLDIRNMADSAFGDEGCETFRQLEAVRQRNLRKAFQEGSNCQPSDNFDALLENYRQTMGLTNTDFSAKQQRMKTVMQTLTENTMGCLYEVTDSDGLQTYGVFFGWDNKRAYYLFGAGHPDRSATHHGTFAFWEALRDLASTHHITEVDWEGVNSPQRGWFKMSFGGSLLPYYELIWNS